VLTILYHDDFDGAASAALLMALLVNTGSQLNFNFLPVDHGMEGLGWDQAIPAILGADFPTEEDFAVVDFLYHPAAKHYFDHHPTAFLTTDWRVDYDMRVLKAEWGLLHELAPSCANLIWQCFPPDGREHYERVRQAADLIDTAGYPSAQAYFDAELPEIALSIGWHALTQQDKVKVIAHLARADVQGAYEAVRERVDPVVVEERLLADRSASYCEIRGNVVILDCVRAGLPLVRFAPYLHYPQARYAFTLYQTGNDVRVSLGKNPWRDEIPGVHLGELARRVGGGGHSFAAGAMFRQSEHPLPTTAAWSYLAQITGEINAAAVVPV
jgi:hypothetical protein